MSSESVARVIFVTLFAFTLYLLYLIFKPFLPGIVWAIVLVVVFQRAYERLVSLFGGRAALAAILLSLFVAAFVVVPTVIAVIKVGQGMVDAYHWLELQQSESETAPPLLERIPGGTWLLEKLDRWGLDVLDLKGAAISTLRNVGAALAASTTNVLRNVFSAALTLIVLLATMAVLFLRGPQLAETVRALLPLSEQDKEAAFATLRAATRGIFLGVMLTALIQGTLGGLGFAFAGLPSPVAFGAAMFFCALLPAGTVIVWGPAVAWLFLDGHPGKALFLLAWGVLVVSTADNFLRPLFIGREVRIHSLLVFFGIFGGMLAFGFVGLFVGPLVITLFLFLIDVAQRDLFPEEEKL